MRIHGCHSFGHGPPMDDGFGFPDRCGPHFGGRRGGCGPRFGSDFGHRPTGPHFGPRCGPHRGSHHGPPHWPHHRPHHGPHHGHRRGPHRGPHHGPHHGFFGGLFASRFGPFGGSGACDRCLGKKSDKPTDTANECSCPWCSRHAFWTSRRCEDPSCCSDGPGQARGKRCRKNAEKNRDPRETSVLFQRITIENPRPQSV